MCLFGRVFDGDAVRILRAPESRRHRGTGQRAERQHPEYLLHATTSPLFSPISSRTSVRCPVMAAAAAMTGETRCVRDPGPCRPMKLRLLVEAQRSPAGTL